MTNRIRIGFITALASTAVLAVAPVFAQVNFQTAIAGSASTGSYSVYSDAVTGNGDGTDAGSNFIGAAFSVGPGGTSALQVGANVDAYGSGQVFAEVVSLSSLSSLPAVTGSGGTALISWLQANSLGSALLNAPGTAGDASAVIDFSSSLAAGSYAVIFGSGLYGAAGLFNLTDGNTTVGTPNVFTSLGGDSFQSFGYDSGIRIFANAVPLPPGLPLLGSALAALAFMRRRRDVTGGRASPRQVSSCLRSRSVGGEY